MLKTRANCSWPKQLFFSVHGLSSFFSSANSSSESILIRIHMTQPQQAIIVGSQEIWNFLQKGNFWHGCWNPTNVSFILEGMNVCLGTSRYRKEKGIWTRSSGGKKKYNWILIHCGLVKESSNKITPGVQIMVTNAKHIQENTPPPKKNIAVISCLSDTESWNPVLQQPSATFNRLSLSVISC